jgi:hypothetical protein
MADLDKFRVDPMDEFYQSHTTPPMDFMTEAMTDYLDNLIIGPADTEQPLHGPDQWDSATLMREIVEDAIDEVGK